MMQNSLLSLGNTRRMKNVIEKARSGDEITIAYIGGSITEGHKALNPERGYAALSSESFGNLYGADGGENIRIINAGMSGTPSTLGIIRYRRDVLEKAPEPPDLVIIEFAVNDADDPTGGATYESLIRRILTAENEPAVILLFSVFQSGWNLQDRFIPLGEYYGLPMVSIRDAVVPEFENGSLTETDFFADIWHPNDRGHRIMADCLTACFEAADSAEYPPADISIPEKPLIGNQFADIRMITPEQIPAEATVDTGAFFSTDKGLGTFMYAPQTLTFPDNWHKKRSADNAPFVMELHCRNLLMVYKKSSDGYFGNAEVFVDGESAGQYDGSPNGGWNNPWTVVLIDEETSGEHRIEIRMTEDDAEAAFTLLAFGYSE